MSGGKIVLIVLAVLGVLFVLAIVACGGFGWWAVNMAKKAADAPVDAMFTAIDNGTFGDTYDTKTTASFRNTMSREEYVAMGEAIKENLGSLQSKTMTGFTGAQENAATFIDVTYDATFEKGTGTIRARLAQEGADMKFEEFTVTSDKLPVGAPVVEEIEDEEAIPAEVPVE